MPDPGKEFIKAAKPGDLKALAVLLDSNPELISARDSDGSTALHCATWKGQEAAVAWLLNAGADVRAHNENDHWGTTALHAAAHANQAHITATHRCRRGRERPGSGGSYAAISHNIP